MFPVNKKIIVFPLSIVMLNPLCVVILLLFSFFFKQLHSHNSCFKWVCVTMTVCTATEIFVAWAQLHEDAVKTCIAECSVCWIANSGLHPSLPSSVGIQFSALRRDADADDASPHFPSHIHDIIAESSVFNSHKGRTLNLTMWFTYVDSVICRCVLNTVSQDVTKCWENKEAVSSAHVWASFLPYMSQPPLH